MNSACILNALTIDPRRTFLVIEPIHPEHLRFEKARAFSRHERQSARKSGARSLFGEPTYNFIIWQRHREQALIAARIALAR